MAVQKLEKSQFFWALQKELGRMNSPSIPFVLFPTQHWEVLTGR